MAISIHKFFLSTAGLLFCLLGCGHERGNILQSADISSQIIPALVAEVKETANIEGSFEQNILPILTARCALAGCHVSGGPDGLDFSTYQTFIRGGNDRAVFIPGNATESEVIEEIVSGKMPPGGPPLTDAEIQLFVDWINQQEPTAYNRSNDNDAHENDDDDDDDAHENDDDDDDDAHENDDDDDDDAHENDDDDDDD